MVKLVPGFYETGTDDSLVSDSNVRDSYKAHSNSMKKTFFNIEDGPHNEPGNKGIQRLAPYEVRFMVAHLFEEEQYQLDKYFYSTTDESLCNNTEVPKHECMVHTPIQA